MRIVILFFKGHLKRSFEILLRQLFHYSVNYSVILAIIFSFLNKFHHKVITFLEIFTKELLSTKIFCEHFHKNVLQEHER